MNIKEAKFFPSSSLMTQERSAVLTSEVSMSAKKGYFANHDFTFTIVMSEIYSNGVQPVSSSDF